MKREEKLIDELRRKGENLEIPRSLEPEWMEEELREKGRRKYIRRGRVYPALAFAACLFLIAGLLFHIQRQGLLEPTLETEQEVPQVAFLEKREPSKEEQELLTLPKLSYEEIYERLSPVWAEKEAAAARLSRGEYAYAEKEEAAASDLSSAETSFGETNVQVEGIDEGDQMKNDGRYLYQSVMLQEKSGNTSRGIQIFDTKDGLKEAAFLGGFENIEEFYVRDGLLIVIENRFYHTRDNMPDIQARKGSVEDLDLLYVPDTYHEISFYGLEDPYHPSKIKTFTLKGAYETSRISDGYFYGISQFTARPGQGKEDYDAYIPTVDGQRLEADKILCPEERPGNGYLVLVSINLADPTKFVDTRAVLTGGGTYYVSEKNIYMADYESVFEALPKQEGSSRDKTKLLRFSYLKGHFYAQASGEVPGRLDTSFSMDEYERNLRLVVTVQEYQVKKVTDERTGEDLGYDYGESRQTNALYILDSFLNVQGKIEGLAEGESIYAARFLGDTGYFVTFRQTDPLFAVDLSNPSKPKLLGELKVTGFSDYLHFYGENKLLGIGMEVDEKTGRQEGLKLSMFDFTNPTDLKEVSRLNLKNYNHSEALYNHRAVLIDVSENLIGFAAEGSNRGDYWNNYLVFSYEGGDFVKKLELNAAPEDGMYRTIRGTFIGNTFYLLGSDGSAKAYDRATGKLLGELQRGA